MKSAIFRVKDSKYTFYLLAFGTIACFGIYFFLINSTVRNAVAETNIDEQVLSLKNKISDLEYRYMISSNSITLDKAKSLGLVEPTNKIFISHKVESSGEVLSLNKQ